MAELGRNSGDETVRKVAATIARLTVPEWRRLVTTNKSIINRELFAKECGISKSALNGKVKGITVAKDLLLAKEEELRNAGVLAPLASEDLIRAQGNPAPPQFDAEADNRIREAGRSNDLQRRLDEALARCKKLEDDLRLEREKNAKFENLRQVLIATGRVMR